MTGPVGSRSIARAGLHPVTVSPFGERHSAWWWYAGYKEIYNPGQGGLEIADAGYSAGTGLDPAQCQ